MDRTLAAVFLGALVLHCSAAQPFLGGVTVKKNSDDGLLCSLPTAGTMRSTGTHTYGGSKMQVSLVETVDEWDAPSGNFASTTRQDGKFTSFMLARRDLNATFTLLSDGTCTKAAYNPPSLHVFGDDSHVVPLCGSGESSCCTPILGCWCCSDSGGCHIGCGLSKHDSYWHPTVAEEQEGTTLRLTHREANTYRHVTLRVSKEGQCLPSSSFQVVGKTSFATPLYVNAFEHSRVELTQPKSSVFELPPDCTSAVVPKDTQRLGCSSGEESCCTPIIGCWCCEIGACHVGCALSTGKDLLSYWHPSS